MYLWVWGISTLALPSLENEVCEQEWKSSTTHYLEWRDHSFPYFPMVHPNILTLSYSPQHKHPEYKGEHPEIVSAHIPNRIGLQNLRAV